MEFLQRLFGAKIYRNPQTKINRVMRNDEPNRKLMVMIVGRMIVGLFGEKISVFDGIYHFFGKE